jgi:catechol 2,3-dioxygenase-like lactoylglutathione lyase family enzyme
MGAPNMSAPSTSATPAQSHGPVIEGFHHVKLPVADLATSRAWYERVFGFVPLHEFADDEGVVGGVAYEPVGGVSLALRADPDRAAGLVGYDPLAFAVSDRSAVEAWTAHLDELAIAHSGVIRATLGHAVACTDPDGMHVLIYSRTAD